MASALFLLHNYADLAVVAASTEASASLGAKNVQDQQRSRIWRSGSGTSSFVNVTRQTSEAVNYAAVVDVNLRPTGSIRVQSWADALGGASPGIDVTVAPATNADDIAAQSYNSGVYGGGGFGGTLLGFGTAKGNLTLISLGASSTHLYWRYTFTDANSSYQECGRIFLADSLTIGVNPSVGWDLRREDESPVLKSIGGQRYVNRAVTYRVFSGVYDFLTDAERQSFLRSHDLLGDITSIVFSLLGDNALGSRPMNLYGSYRGPRMTGAHLNINELAFEVAEDL